jgi:hypothetical protein
MAYTVNIVISAGCDFSQNFYLINPDYTPKNISGCNVTANLAKHSNSLDAMQTTSEEIVWNRIPLTGYVEDGVGGVFSLNLSADETKNISEGKYVYGAVIKDINGNEQESVSGLAFVTVAMGSNKPTSLNNLKW